MIGTLGIISIVVSLLLGAPIFCVFGAAALLGWYIEILSWSQFPCLLMPATSWEKAGRPVAS
jgi:hypothetical protein